jgi:CheY-specific phosphatase CheX
VLEERLGLLALSTPTVIFGRNYKTRSASVLEWTVIPFRSGEEDMEVRFYLLSSKQHPHAALRP